MDYKRYNDTIILRIDRDEEIIEKITEIIKLEKIQLAEVSGIGAVKMATIGAYDLNQHIYNKKDFIGTYEISSLNGNITTMNDESYLHLHIVLGSVDGVTISGHLNKAIIGVTSEIFIRIIDGKLDRIRDDFTGINILKF